MGGGSRGGGLTLKLSVGEGGGVEINICLVRGGVRLILSRILSISQPPPPPSPGNYSTVP